MVINLILYIRNLPHTLPKKNLTERKTEIIAYTTPILLAAGLKKKVGGGGMGGMVIAIELNPAAGKPYKITTSCNRSLTLFCSLLNIFALLNKKLRFSYVDMTETCDQKEYFYIFVLGILVFPFSVVFSSHEINDF